MSDRWSDDPERANAMHALRERLADLQKRSRSLPPGPLRHDVGNAVGAARNALVLLDDAASPNDPLRFFEMAQRNIARAEVLLRGDLADAPPRESGRNERNDLGRSGERDHRDAFGL